MENFYRRTFYVKIKNKVKCYFIFFLFFVNIRINIFIIFEIKNNFIAYLYIVSEELYFKEF